MKIPTPKYCVVVEFEFEPEIVYAYVSPCHLQMYKNFRAVLQIL
jgi:hypothetical protein